MISVLKIFLCFTALTFQAWSQVQFEPGLGVPVFSSYEKSSGKGGDLWGLSFSAKFGYKIIDFSAGVDASIRQLASDSDNNLEDDQFFTRETGFFFKYQINKAWQTWFTTILEVDADNSDSSDYSGAGYKFGVSRFLNEYINLQIEYVSHKYDEFRSGSTAASQQLDETLRHDLFVVTLSIPMEFELPFMK